jgi:hypothetical protein
MFHARGSLKQRLGDQTVGGFHPLSQCRDLRRVLLVTFTLIFEKCISDGEIRKGSKRMLKWIYRLSM